MDETKLTQPSFANFTVSGFSISSFHLTRVGIIFLAVILLFGDGQMPIFTVLAFSGLQN